MDKVRVGIIGAGFIGPAHIESMRRLGFVDVVALATSNEASAKAKAKALSIPRAFGRWEDMLDEDVDVIHIAGPNYLHCVQAKAALEAGKHVVCEKPMGMNSKETGEALALARKKRLVHGVSFNHRYYPLVKNSRALVQKGELGEIYMVRGGYHQEWLFYDTDYNWRVESKLGGPLKVIGDIGTHCMDTVQHVSGLKIEAVYAQLANFIKYRKKPKTMESGGFTGKERSFIEQGTPDKASAAALRASDYEQIEVDSEDCAIVLVRFTGSRALGVITASQVSAGRKTQLSYELNGSKASIAWDSESPNHLWIGHRNRPNELMVKDPSLMEPSARRWAAYPEGHAEGFPDSHTQCNRDIYEYIRGEKWKEGIEPEFPTFETGHEEQLLIEAIQRSSQTGTWSNVR